jgi:hypothetical protein
MTGAIVWGMLKGAKQHTALKQRGVPTTAQVIERDLQPDTGAGETYSFKVQYTVDGTTYQEKVGVSVTDYYNYQLNSTVEVVYLPDKPKVVALKGYIR